MDTRLTTPAPHAATRTIEHLRLELVASKRPVAVALVACGKAKTTDARPAAELYTGSLFVAALAHARATSDVVFIVSALHGLVPLDAILAPYDHKLAPRDAYTWAGGVVDALNVAIPYRRQVTIHAGETYADALAARLCGKAIDPLKGKTLGARLAFYKNARELRARMLAFHAAGGTGLARASSRLQAELFAIGGAS